jgi:hypothetical protein
MHSNVFTQFTHLPKLDIKYLEEAVSLEYITPEETDGVKRGRVIRAASSFSSTKFYSDLHKEFGDPFRVNFYKNNPNTVYDWHRDLDRKCSLNFLLTENPNYLTLSRTATNNRLVWDITQCTYTPFYPALLNTEIEHCVINYSSETRYILSVCPGGGSYKDVLDFLMNYQCTDY